MLFEVIIPAVELDYSPQAEDEGRYGQPKDPQPEIRGVAVRSLVEADDAKAAAIKLIRSQGGTNLPVSALVATAGETVTVDLTA